MKPIRRKINRHFGLTAKQVAVRSHRPWYFQWLLAIAFMLLGFVGAYWYLYDAGDKDRYEKGLIALKQLEEENQVLQTKLIQAQRDLQLELATNNNLAKELATVQDENLKIKEDLVFYKNMMNKRTK